MHLIAADSDDQSASNLLPGSTSYPPDKAGEGLLKEFYEAPCVLISVLSSAYDDQENFFLRNQTPSIYQNSYSSTSVIAFNLCLFRIILI